jgi:hypothetical protein
MRGTTVAMAFGLYLRAGTLRADSPRSRPTDVGPGRVAWFDITTSTFRNRRRSTASFSVGCSRRSTERIGQSRSSPTGQESARFVWPKVGSVRSTASCTSRSVTYRQARQDIGTRGNGTCCRSARLPRRAQACGARGEDAGGRRSAQAWLGDLGVLSGGLEEAGPDVNRDTVWAISARRLTPASEQDRQAAKAGAISLR